LTANLKTSAVKKIIKRVLSRFGLYVITGYKDYFLSNKKIVTAVVYGRKVLLPKAHSITYNLSHFPYYNSNLQRIVQSCRQHRQDSFSIVDIGANIGDTLLMLRQVTDLPVHCFEGDDFYFDLLQKNTAGIANSHLHKVLLSDKPGQIRVHSKISLGSSQFVTDDDKAVWQDFTSIDNYFHAHLPDEPVGVLKTDTDGFDLRIIEGGAATIRRNHPVIFLEYDRALFEPNGSDGLRFFALLEELGYSGLVVYDNYGKLLCITSLQDQTAIKALHAYIGRKNTALPFYDLAVFSAADETLFRSFAASELAFFEK
jgi:FkbM family methyltransferase